MSEPKLTDREISIRARMAAGLTRDQATRVQDDQEAHDAELAKAEKPAAPAAKKNEGEKK